MMKLPAWWRCIGYLTVMLTPILTARLTYHYITDRNAVALVLCIVLTCSHCLGTTVLWAEREEQ